MSHDKAICNIYPVYYQSFGLINIPNRHTFFDAYICKTTTCVTYIWKKVKNGNLNIKKKIKAVVGSLHVLSITTIFFVISS